MSMRPPSSLPVPSVVMRLRQWAAAAGAVTLSVMPLFAGDILRGGAPAQGRGASQAGGPPPVQTAKARAAVQDSLARTARAVQDVRAMQQSARAAAQAAGPLRHPTVPGVMLPVVPNGLKPGGLQLAGSPVGALNPVQSGAGGAAAAQVTVKQTAQQALLNWNSFNIGKETTLKFDQSAGGANRNQWIAFNKVNDPSGLPSQILGSLQADGQVYVINQNGIIFGGTSQVNVHTLTASALPNCFISSFRPTPHRPSPVRPVSQSLDTVPALWTTTCTRCHQVRWASWPSRAPLAAAIWTTSVRPAMCAMAGTSPATPT